MIFFTLILLIAAFFGLQQAIQYATDLYYENLFPLHYEQLILTYSKEYDLEPAFVAAVINAESSFQPEVVSSADAYGLMQIQPATFDWAKAKCAEERPLTKEDLKRPEINIQYGCLLYRLLIDEFGSMENAVIAYHAGWGNLKKWLANPEYSKDGKTLDSIPFQDTAHYLNSILKNLEVYRTRYPQLASQVSK